MKWLRRKLCPVIPEHHPVVEDQREWVCPRCGVTWVWATVFEGIGWVRR